jgi:cbb3-type cytochrome oxidase maturation protein
MSVIYVLLPLAFVLGIAAVWAFVRATRAGQFDDLETPAHRILHDDEGASAHPCGSRNAAQRKLETPPRE